nr:hypothetical protein [Paenibacillus peoriae]
MNADHQDPGVRRENQVQRAGRRLEHTASATRSRMALLSTEGTTYAITSAAVEAEFAVRTPSEPTWSRALSSSDLLRSSRNHMLPQIN